MIDIDCLSVIYHIHVIYSVVYHTHSRARLIFTCPIHLQELAFDIILCVSDLF